MKLLIILSALSAGCSTSSTVNSDSWRLYNATSQCLSELKATPREVMLKRVGAPCNTSEPCTKVWVRRFVDSCIKEKMGES